MSIHDGHRNRMKQRFLNDGLEHFQPHEVLELLLFYCIPRQDTNGIAHSLLERFGTLEGVFSARVSELSKVPGIGENAATFLSLVAAASRYYEVSRHSNDRPLNSIEECAAVLRPYFTARRNEMVYLLCLDAKGKAIACRFVGEGSVNSAAVPIRRIVEMALADNATSVVLAHNHPSGLALPSAEDVQTTRRLSLALQTVDIHLVDHIIVADDECVSMVQSGMFDPRDCRLLV